MIRTSCIRRPRTNAVLPDFKHISGDLGVQIMQSYCSSFYGSQLWDLSNKCTDRISIIIIRFAFLKKVGCHDSPLLPILGQSHEVSVSHSRPFCDICHPLRSWPSSAYFPILWTLRYQPVDVVTSDHQSR